MNDRLTFWATFTEMTLLLLGKILLLNFFFICCCLCSYLLCWIFKKCVLDPPNLFYLVMEINYKQAFWPSFTGVVLVLMGQILNI